MLSCVNHKFIYFNSFPITSRTIRSLAGPVSQMPSLFVRTRSWDSCRGEHSMGKYIDVQTTNTSGMNPTTCQRLLAFGQSVKYYEQECIPVGCVPSAAVAVCRRGLSAQGVFARGGVSALGGVCIPACTEADTIPPWTEFLTHAFENITLPQLLCGR